MAAEKNSFLLYTDLIHTVSHLPDNLAGKLFKHILKYVNDQVPGDPKDLRLKIAFEPIKHQLKRDLRKWEKTRSKLSTCGKRGGIKSGESRRNKATLQKTKPCEAIEAVTATATANVNVTATAIQRAVEFMTFYATGRLTLEQITEQATLLVSQYQGKKVGNLKALCNKWIDNYLAQETLPAIEPTYWDKMRAAL